MTLNQSSRWTTVCACAVTSVLIPFLHPVLLAETPSLQRLIGVNSYLITKDSSSESALQKQIREIAAEAQGKVSVACSLPGSSLNCDLNPNAQPPMQSVFKLPLALTVLHHVEQGTLGLDQPVSFLPADRILPHAYSPLQDKYPEAGVDVPLRELLRLTVSLSDNAAADILLRLVGGPGPVSAYMASIGVTGFNLQDGETHVASRHDRPISQLVRAIWSRSTSSQDQRQFAADIEEHRSAPELDASIGTNKATGSRSSGGNTRGS